MLQIAVCDDDICDGQYTMSLIKQILLERCVDASFSFFEKPDELIEDVGSNCRKYDLLLLDMLLGKITGIQLAEELRRIGCCTPLIYTTVSRDFAIDGYKVKASDYLLKPLQKSELADSISRVLRGNDSILVESDNVLKNIPISDIHYAEAYGNYVILQTSEPGKGVRIRATLSAALQRLGEDRFARCHRGYLVNMEMVREVHGSHIFLSDGSMIPLGRQYREELPKMILNYIEKALPR